MAAIGILGMLGFVVFLILLIVSAIRKRKKRTHIIGLSVCFVAFIVGVAFSPNSSGVSSKTTLASDPSSSDISSNVLTSSDAPPANEDIPSPSPTWKTIKTFTGNSTKTTEKFTVDSDNWRIVWSTHPGKYGDMNFIINLRQSDGIPSGVIANIIGTGGDTSYVYTGGEYYLEINTAQNYMIYIQEEE